MGTEKQGQWAVLSMGGPRVFLVLLAWQKEAGEMLWCFTVNFTGSCAPIGRILLPLGVQRTQVLSHWLGYGGII